MHSLPTQTPARIATILLGIAELAVTAVFAFADFVLIVLFGRESLVLGTHGIAQRKPLEAVGLLGCVAIVVCGLLWFHIMIKYTVEHSILAKHVFDGN